MTDKPAPKPKKEKKEKEAKVPGPKLVIATGVGHNSGNTGEKNPEAIKLLEEIMGYQTQKKAIAKAERDARNRLKTEFHILASSVSREVSLRKLDADVRVQVETNHEDFKKLVGYQPSLDFAGAKPTDASVKAQPSEAELNERSTEPQRGVNPGAAAAAAGVITREG